MLAITATSPIVSPAPSAPIGRLMAGEASVDLQHSSFAPAEQPSESPRAVNERDRDEQPNSQRQRERLNLAASGAADAAASSLAPALTQPAAKPVRTAASSVAEAEVRGPFAVAEDVASIQAQLEYRTRFTAAAPLNTVAAEVSADEVSVDKGDTDAVATSVDRALGENDKSAVQGRVLPEVAALAEQVAAREAAEKDEKGRVARREIMELVSERSIRLNQRLLEVALTHRELDVGVAINRHV